VAAAKLGKEEEAAGGKTIVQQLSPGRGRWGRGPGSGLPTGPEKKEPSGWVLKGGEPVEIKVTTGLTDGNDTEVSGEGLTEGADIIVSAKPVMKS
jgi:HlyD family secretion protein